MAHLTLVGLSGDRKRLLLVDDAGQEFTLDADASLRSALRGEDPRPGHLETRMDSAIRPRDIQSRIRSGETPEAVAEAAQTTVERIMTYAAPVLAERAHVAMRAQVSSVRRRSAEGAGSLGGGRTLGEAVANHLRSDNVDPGSVEWDAFRREDGRWTLTGVFSTPGRSGTATFTFDVPGNYVTVDDDDARWLVGEAPARSSAEPEPEPGPTRRRLSSVPAEELPLGDDALELVAEPPAEPVPTGEDRTAPAAAEDSTLDLNAVDLDAVLPVEAFLSDDDTDEAGPGDDPAGTSSEAPRSRRRRRKGGEDGPVDAGEGEPEPEAPRRPVKKSRGRASVPSWDEIMFGGGSGD